MHNCDLVNLDDMLQNGTVISGTYIEKPHSFSTACNIATQIIAQVASNQYGGQSISLTHLAPFVDVSRKKIAAEVEAEMEGLDVSEGATVSVAFDKDAFADSGLKFGHWDITGLDDPNAYQDKESFAFVMPAKAVTLKAMTQDASIEDDEPDIVGPIVIGTTVVVGGAVLGYQAYSLGAEFAGKLMALPYFPSNRSALAMMLWEDAGKPMPESELLYPDVGQEEQDMDLQHAARWAMENELIPDLNDEGTAPEEMKFYPDNTVSKLDVLKAWQKAQELKQNA
jgi:hypothetical protein